MTSPHHCPREYFRRFQAAQPLTRIVGTGSGEAAMTLAAAPVLKTRGCGMTLVVTLVLETGGVA